MANDWTRVEVEACVADYLDMLVAELTDRPYSKTRHREHLRTKLRSRSDSAIEKKHQNISAILIRLGFPYIPGYKPLGNYQRLLSEVLADRTRIGQPIVELVETLVEEPATLPTIDEILKAQVEPPGRPTSPPRYQEERVRERPELMSGVDYLEREARNRSLGAAGEEFVVRFEVARLREARQDHLASQVERVSESRGDGLGYDVLSFEESGQERLVEVKTTAYGAETPFFVTRNEVDVSARESEQYFLYRLFDFRRRPRLYQQRGNIERAFALDPLVFRASVL